MLSHYHELEIGTGQSFAVRDVTAEVADVLEESGVREGMVVITSMHTTCAVSVNENEQRLFDDIRDYYLKIAPPDASYKHNDLHLRVNIPPDEPENAHAHLIAMMLGNSETVPVHDGSLVLGRYQAILLREMDGPRKRKLAVQVFGMK